MTTSDPSTPASDGSPDSASTTVPSTSAVTSDSPAGPPPPSEPPAATGASPGFQWAGIPFDRFGTYLHRAVQANFQTQGTTDAERAEFATAITPTRQPLAQDYLAWRQGTLWLALCGLILTAIFGVIDFFASVSEYSNFTALVVANAILAFSVPVGAVLAWFAVQKATNFSRSRDLARWAWAVTFLTPLAVAAVPWAKLTGAGQLGGAEGVSFLGMVLGLALAFHVAPTVIGACAGMIRSANLIKTMLPESLLPGWVIVAAAPVYTVLMLTLFIVVNQTAVSYLLTIGVLLVAAGPAIYLVYLRQVARPHTVEEVGSVIVATRAKAAGVVGLGVLLIVAFGVEHELFGVIDMLRFVAAIVGSVLLVSVVAADFLLAAINSGNRQMQEYLAGPHAAEVERKWEALGESQIGSLWTRDGKNPRATQAAPDAAGPPPTDPTDPSPSAPPEDQTDPDFAPPKS